MGNLFRMESEGANIHQIGRSTLFEGHPVPPRRDFTNGPGRFYVRAASFSTHMAGVDKEDVFNAAYTELGAKGLMRPRALMLKNRTSPAAPWSPRTPPPRPHAARRRQSG
jgi:hypothetical protein